MFLNSVLIAQVTNPALSGGLGRGWDYINTIIPRILNIVYIIAVVIFVFIFIVGAFQWITAGGDKGKLAEARGKITHAIIGLLILLFIFLISRLVYLILGVDIANFGTTESGSPTPTSIVSTYRDCTDNCTGSTVGYCIPDGIAPPSLTCIDSNTNCFDPQANCFCCPVAPTPVTYRDCSVLCTGTSFSTTPVGYCVPGNNPPAPFPGCVNAGRDCTNPLQDCYCCPQPTPTALPTITPIVNTPTPTPPFYNITAVPVCSNGATPTIRTQMAYIYWPPNPFVIQYDSPLFVLGQHSISLRGPSGTVQTLYIGLTNEDELIIPGSNNNYLRPYGTPPTGWSYGVYWSPQTWQVVTHSYSVAPSGTYTFNFEVPVTYCSGSPVGGVGPLPPTTPSPTPTPTRILTPTPTRVPTNTPTPTRAPTSTPLPTSTPTRAPTATPLPTNTPVPTVTLTPTPTIAAFCTDSDGGLNYTSYGFTSSMSSLGVFSSNPDSCASSTILNEAYCQLTTSRTQQYDCSSGDSPSASHVCSAGRCCVFTGSPCVSSSDCCSSNICNGGICQAASNIILNEATGISCRDLCWLNGFRSGDYCQSVGTNSTADNGMTYVDSCNLTNIYGCYSGILASVSSPLCNGHMTNWTYCNCVPNSVSAACNGGYGCITNQECDYMAGGVCAYDPVSGTNCCQ